MTHHFRIYCFFFGILSVWFARQENILVYPTGLIATIITVYLLYVAGYIGDMLINAYFTIMSIYGWYKWSRKTSESDNLPITGQIKRKK
jgi:nicotinamide mononucleotide transporter